MTNETLPLSDLTLERYRLDELPAAEAARVQARVAADPALRARIAALDASDREFAARHGSAVLERALAGRASGGGRVSPVPGWFALAGAAVVAVSLTAWTMGPWRPGGSPHDTAGDAGGGVAAGAAAPGVAGAGDATVRVKGDAAALLVYRQVGASSELLTDGDAARAGDVVRVAYRAATPRFGVIVSIDGRGVVTRHLPVTGSTAVPLAPGDATPLASAYELDDAPRYERFFLITSDAAFDVEAVIEAAEAAAHGASADPPDTLRLPDGLAQTSFLLKKVF
ncbi:MAG: hypothetical protein R2752_18610 [Vicinamibacterales bacterium]